LKHPKFERKPCLSFTEFVTNPEYLGVGEDTWRRIKEEGDEIWELILQGRITEAVLLWGIGAGKSYMSTVLCLMFVHLLLCLKSPHKYFNIANDKPIAVVNMGTTATQAKNVIFAGLTKFVEISPFFKQYNPDILKTEIRFKGKNLVLFCGNSQETMPIGMNVIMALLDEVAFYLDNEEKSVAENIYNTVKNRITSRFGDMGIVIMMSSVRYVDDFIMKKYDEAGGVDYIHRSIFKTWEMKDREKMSKETFNFVAATDKDGNPVEVWENIPIDFKKVFDRSPERSMRDFGCKPSLALEAFDKDSAIVDRVSVDRESPISNDNSFKDWFVCTDNEPRFIHIDLALKKDCCGFCMGKCDGSETEYGEVRKKVYIDLMMQIKALPDKEINFNEVRQIIYILQDRGFKIKEVSYDGWQSIDSIQILKSRGINAYTLSVDKTTESYDTLKEVLHTRRINIYKFDPFVKEYKRLELIKGKKVDHPQDGSKDVSDAVAGTCFMIAGKPAGLSFSTENSQFDKNKPTEKIVEQKPEVVIEQKTSEQLKLEEKERQRKELDLAIMKNQFNRDNNY